MARFTFPVPGRRKPPPAVIATEPIGKVHKILGPMSSGMDDLKGLDGVSNSGISVTVTDSTSPTYDGRSEMPSRHVGIARSTVEWGDESEILPKQFRGQGYGDESTYGMPSEVSSVLRRRQSSSTITSWYDKSKQPLSISQQTSASAMAKGPPSKAQRMLDMSNTLAGATPKNKKKPARLDLSNANPGSRASRLTVDGQENNNGVMLGHDYVMRSPSILSQLTPPAGGRKLQKRSTKESLRAAHAAHAAQAQAAQAAHNANIANGIDPTRPATSGSPRRKSHFPNGVPDLYEHYEQMSLRQIMDLETNKEESMVDKHLEAARNRAPKPVIRQTQSELQMRRHVGPAGHLRQKSQGSSVVKIGRLSPAMSVSSGNTRTSKASRRTDNSFQTADLQGKSVLSLSSDSEEETYIERPIRSSPPAAARKSSDADQTVWRDSVVEPPKACQGADDADQNSTKSSKGSKRASFAPFHTYLPLPKAPGTKSPSTSSRGTSPSMSTFHVPASPSRVSLVSSSSASTALTWHSKPGYGVQEARAITMLSAQGPAGRESEQEPEQNSVIHSPVHQSTLDTSSIATSTDQPTPPLSPSSADFYIRSAPSAQKASDGQNRFMAVTRQEEMLLAALRQKRQYMRESGDQQPAMPRENTAKGHRSKASDATITQDLFDFDFPEPASNWQETGTESSSSSMIDHTTPAEKFPWNSNMFTKSTGDVTSSVLSPAPQTLQARKSILKKHPSQREKAIRNFERSVSPGTPIEETEPSPDLSDFIDFDDEPSAKLLGPPPINVSSFPQPRPRRLNDLAAGHRSSLTKHRQLYKGGQLASAENMIVRTEEDPKFLVPSAGVPRPDSPVSPDAFPSPPSHGKRMTLDKKMARLSAVGSSRLGEEPTWWGDDD